LPSGACDRGGPGNPALPGWRKESGVAGPA